MDVGWQIQLLILIALFIIYAFFSASEIALFSLDKRAIKTNLKENKLVSRYLLYLLEYPRRLLVTILIGSNISNVALSILAVNVALLVADYYGINPQVALSVQIILLTLLVVMFGEIVPKVYSSKNTTKMAKFASVPLYWFNIIFYPIAETLTEIIKLTIDKVKLNKNKTAISPEEISELANLSHEKGTIIEEEHGLIHGIVNFRQVAVHEVMTPRVDMIAIPVESTLEEVIDIITTSGHSRIPLYEDDLDKILGVIYAKDVLPFIKHENSKKPIDLKKIARKAMFVPPTKKINDLLHEFQIKKMHLAIIVDEYGGTAGLITLEDIIEEIIGEIRDEYDKEENTITKLNEDEYLVLGKLSIDELNELLNLEIQPENDDFETVGGLVMNMAGSIPKENFSFELLNYKFTVKEVFNKRIKKVYIKKVGE